MTTPPAYTNREGETHPVPPVDQLLSYVCLGSTNHMDLTPEQHSAVMDWWFVIDHPGWDTPPGLGDDLSAAVEHMRASGFSEPDIRMALLVLTMQTPFEEGPATNFLIEIIKKAGDAK